MTDTSSPTSSRFAFLHRRPFWAVVCGLAVLFCFWALSEWQSGPFQNTVQAVTSISYATGGLVFGMLGGKFFGAIGGYIYS